jgi:hypothetical protein
MRKSFLVFVAALSLAVSGQSNQAPAKKDPYAGMTLRQAKAALAMDAQAGAQMWTNLQECRNALQQRAQAPAQDPPIEGAVTVIFDHTPRQVDLNVGLTLHGVNLGKLPSVRVGPEGPLYPHWVLRGIVAPMVAGEDRGAVYYYFQNGQWLGPYPPENVLQQ